MPTPTKPFWFIVRTVEVAESASDEVPILKSPSMAESNQCFLLVGASVSVSEKYGVEEATESVQLGEEVPMPTLPAESMRRRSVRPVEEFFVENVRAEAGRVVEMSVKKEAIWAVEVEVVATFWAEKRRPAPIPAPAPKVEVAE